MSWISVEDRLPDGAQRVLVNHKLCGRIVAGLVGNYDVNTGVFTPIRWGVINDIDFEFEDVTHWQPLPEPPK